MAGLWRCCFNANVRNGLVMHSKYVAHEAIDMWICHEQTKHVAFGFDLPVSTLKPVSRKTDQS